jgi:beta-barrel assembly-enhancing protease
MLAIAMRAGAWPEGSADVAVEYPMIGFRLRPLLKNASFLLLLAALPQAGGAAPAAPAVPDAEVQSLLALRLMDERVARIGHRLAVANVGLCPSPAMLPGLAVHDLSQYGGASQAAAARAFGLGRRPAILAVAPGSAAARAGILPDDVLLAIDGAAPGAGAAGSRRASFDTVERILDSLDKAAADGRADLVLLRGGRQIAARIEPDLGCPSRFQIIVSRDLGAKADGKYVQVTSELAKYADGDDELAAVLAHELAHNILRHRARLDQAGISRGLLQSFGRNARLTRQTEVEADQLSVYLLDRAGYDPSAAARFWSRFGRHNSLGIFASPTHPRWKERVATLEQEVRRLDQVKRQSPAATPPLLAGPLPELQ